MTKSEIAKAVAFNEDLPMEKATSVVERVVETMKTALILGKDITIRGFGTIKVVETAQKTARNISTGEAVIVPPTKTVKIKISKELKEALNKH